MVTLGCFWILPLLEIWFKRRLWPGKEMSLNLDYTYSTMLLGTGAIDKR
jgi:hypothetical protein